jgi:hypothetical protein
LPLVVFYASDGTVKWANYYTVSSLSTGTNSIAAIKIVGTTYIAMGYNGVDIMLQLVDFATGRTVDSSHF